MARKKLSIEQQLADARQDYVRAQQKVEADKARLAQDTENMQAISDKINTLESQLVLQYRHAANISFEELITLLSDLAPDAPPISHPETAK